MHEDGFNGIAVVVAHEVQHAVRRQERHLQGARDAQPAGVSRRGVGGDDNLPDERSRRPRGLHGKGQHVGAARDAAMGAVEPADLGIADHSDFHGSPRSAQPGQRALRGAGQAGAVEANARLAIVDEDGHQDGADAPRGAASCAS